ncbi:MAG: hypothetical protein K2W92_07685 [Alphaproteobacteria bacterium]|nr:hypothetical protein [Alphaproteobacteria bacterium]
MPQLDISTFPSQLFWLLICFLALYVILAYIAVPKITQVLEKRQDIIEEKINKASADREQAENLLADYEATLAKARDIAQQNLKSNIQVTNAEIVNKQKDFLDKLNEHLHLMEQNLYRARLEATSEISFVATDVANEILLKLTGHPYSPDDFPQGKEEPICL